MSTPIVATGWPDARRLASALQSAAPAALFGLRLWAAVCLALYIAFWLQLDNTSWAGTSAAIVCQPNLGASLREGWFRMVGTVGRRGDDRGADCVLSTRSDRLSPRSGALGRRVRTRRHVVAQLRGLRGGARRLYGCDHRERRTRCDRGRKWGGFHTGGDPRQRDLHRHHLRWRGPRRDGFRRRAPPPGCPARYDFGRNCRRACQHVLVGRPG